MSNKDGFKDCDKGIGDEGLDDLTFFGRTIGEGSEDFDGSDPLYQNKDEKGIYVLNISEEKGLIFRVDYPGFKNYLSSHCPSKLAVKLFAAKGEVKYTNADDLFFRFPDSALIEFAEKYASIKLLNKLKDSIAKGSATSVHKILEELTKDSE